MKNNIRALAITLGLCLAGAGFAATPATPATPAATASATASAASTAPADSAAKPAASATKKAPAAMPTVAAAGGGNGKVWVNEKSKAYHCEGSKFYGKTKQGEYMTEADAKAHGDHPATGKACAK
ncbi:hypothetical protein RD110_12240 [Rhodoferax koreense]|uniref:Uncharacterized protein n=1 Tax=Rhodoferax koreensis TaxID=1842727 RepID=A0A1P8JVU5_9BURK|nr:hypothetical protein [Rhodoferax koreense]APW37872.1 hypothetical protein RD110_12240 [Rhodoferax koreense]